GMIATAREAAAARGLKINFAEGDVERPAYARGRFSVVSSRLVLFTLPHPGAAVRCWAEMLQPGGRLVLIGEDHTGQPERTSVARSEKPAPRPPGSWQPSEAYREALEQLPFMNHTKEMLGVVMEAAGLEAVSLVAVEEVYAARQALLKQAPTTRTFGGRPYVLVGQKRQ
ncbi:MAG: methyltransferase domain-containing protein, partial [Phycisphaerae bacterium]